MLSTTPNRSIDWLWLKLDNRIWVSLSPDETATSLLSPPEEACARRVSTFSFPQNTPSAISDLRRRSLPGDLSLGDFLRFWWLSILFSILSLHLNLKECWKQEQHWQPQELHTCFSRDNDEACSLLLLQGQLPLSPSGVTSIIKQKLEDTCKVDELIYEVAATSDCKKQIAMWKVSFSATIPCFCISPPIPTSISSHSSHHNTTAEETIQYFKNSSSRPQNTQIIKTKPPQKRIFFLDVNPICYDGAKPSLPSFTHWLSLFLSQVSLQDPVVAVLDGEGGSEFRRQMLPSYKAHRRKFIRNAHWVPHQTPHITQILENCNVPVIRVKGWEADDVVATLVDQVLKMGLGFKVVVGSPDKDFKQLISEDVQVVMPIPQLGRWSFYTIKHYIEQYKCDPTSDLSLRCILGDEVDGVPGIQHLVPGFGRKTALKLLKKHGSLEKLLEAAAVRTVGKQYAQDALVDYADYLRRNYEVLRLRRDVDVQLEEEWLCKRANCNDSAVLSSLMRKI